MIPNPNGDHQQIVRGVSLQPDPLKETEKMLVFNHHLGATQVESSGIKTRSRITE